MIPTMCVSFSAPPRSLFYHNMPLSPHDRKLLLTLVPTSMIGNQNSFFLYLMEKVLGRDSEYHIDLLCNFPYQLHPCLSALLFHMPTCKNAALHFGIKHDNMMHYRSPAPYLMPLLFSPNYFPSFSDPEIPRVTHTYSHSHSNSNSHSNSRS